MGTLHCTGSLGDPLASTPSCAFLAAEQHSRSEQLNREYPAEQQIIDKLIRTTGLRAIRSSISHAGGRETHSSQLTNSNCCGASASDKFESNFCELLLGFELGSKLNGMDGSEQRAERQTSGRVRQNDAKK